MSPSLRPMVMRGLVIAVVLAFATPVSAQVLKIGDRMVELDKHAVDEAGKKVQLREYKGKWLVITVGASWCIPCKKELPTWDRMAKNMGDKAVFVAINIDDTVADGKRFNAGLKLKNMRLVYLPRDGSAVVGRYGADTMPTTFVFDGKQVIRFRKDGFQERDPDGEYKKFRAELAKLIP